MSPQWQLAIWIALAAAAWTWLIVSDIRTGELGWSFADLRRAERPKAFWIVFTAQHLIILLLLVLLAR
jgi:hypothetical protein